MNNNPLDSSSQPQHLPLPGPGPVWFPSVMGTGILANLLQIHAERLPGAHDLALAILIVAWALLLFLSVGFIVRVMRDPQVFTASVRAMAALPFWSTVSMGYLSVGSASTVVIPSYLPQWHDSIWVVNTWMWVFGTVVGVSTALVFAFRIIGVDRGDPTTVWGLAVVGPMVSSTTGANLAAHVPHGVVLWLQVASAACFFLSFYVGAVIFSCVYHHFWRVATIPVAASASAWIPLGMVGQSAAAAQAMALQAEHVLVQGFGQSVHQIAHTYGWIMVVVGIPMVAWACAVTLRGFRKRMPFSPGWWALTFPIGTLALGATLLGAGTQIQPLVWLGAVGTLCLVGTVTLCLVASARAVLRG
ncbi:C4-dicarboxylate ABC transporter [Corynebacterium diphtheriae]|nr:C4-dicarboxylate ABC transporter [Corynebacterium diphtheriae]